MGLRIGECLALDIHDIDLMNRKIYVHKTLTRDSKGYTKLSNSPKTQAGNRYLPIPDSLYPYIIEQMRYCESQKTITINCYLSLHKTNIQILKMLIELYQKY